MKKWILLVAAALILGVILFFYVSFNGNFVTKMVAKAKVEDFVEETYKGHNKQLVDSGFSFKDGRYYFHYEIYTEATRANYSFSIGGPLFLDDRIFSYLDLQDSDEEMMESFSKAGANWLMEQLDAKGIVYDDVGYSVEIPKGLFTGEVSWQPQVDQKLMPYVSFELKDENQSAEEFLQQAEEIRGILKEQDVTYNEARVSVTREFDNTDGSKEGYAPIYYETLYSTIFTPETGKLELN